MSVVPLKVRIEGTRFLNPKTRPGHSFLTAAMYERLKIAWHMCVFEFVKAAFEELDGQHVDTGMTIASLRPLGKAIQVKPDKVFNFTPTDTSFLNDPISPKSPEAKLRRYRAITKSWISGKKDQQAGEELGAHGWNVYVGRRGLLTFDYQTNIYQWAMHENMISPMKGDEQFFEWHPSEVGFLAMKDKMQDILHNQIPSLCRALARAQLGFLTQAELIAELNELPAFISEDEDFQ